MNKIKLGLLMIVSTGVLSACSYDVGEIRNEKFEVVEKLTSNFTGDYDVLKDEDTGCYYIAYSYGADITAYYDEEGNVMGCGKD